MIRNISILAAFIAVVFFTIFHFAHAQTLSSTLSGRILLQVEDKGQAWYVNPNDQKRYSLGRPTEAFNLMREKGIGITNVNLQKIFIAPLNYKGDPDSDGDGLSDSFETIYGTDRQKSDSDGDGYGDGQEVKGGYSPLEKSGPLRYDKSFSQNQLGKIFLQVENKGAAWYINPVDQKAYYLGRPADAFMIMRTLGLGITNASLNQIVSGDTGNNINPTKQKKCADGTNYDSCSSLLPQYCYEGVLIDQAPLCGCPAGKIIDGNSCSDSSSIIKQCSDGTLFNNCSNSKPAFCNAGALVDKSFLCGCPVGQTANGEHCVAPVVVQKCLDGTVNNSCTGIKPFYCANGVFIEKASSCGCPEGKVLSGDKCITPIVDVKKCTDNTVYGQCSTSRPQYCSEGTLIEKASLCGCPIGLVLNGERCVAPVVAQRCPDGTAYNSCTGIKPLYCSEGLYIEKASTCGCPEGKVLSGDKCLSLPKSVLLNLSTFPSDFLNSVDEGLWEERLNIVYRNYVDLTGGDTKDFGNKITILADTQMPYCGLAGNPIKLSVSGGCLPLTQLNNGDPGWNGLHELGHDFTLGYSYAYNGNVVEGFGSFLAYYNYDIGSFPQKSTYTRKYFDDHYTTYIDSSKDWSTIDADALIDIFLKLKDVYGWDLFKTFFRIYRSSDPASNKSNTEKARLMVQRLADSAESIRPGTGRSDVIAKFKTWRFPTP